MPPFLSQHHAVLNEKLKQPTILCSISSTVLIAFTNLLLALSRFVFFTNFYSLPHTFIFYFYSSLSGFLQWGETFGLPRVDHEVIIISVRHSFAVIISPSFYRRLYIRWPHSELCVPNHLAIIILPLSFRGPHASFVPLL